MQKRSAQDARGVDVSYAQGQVDWVQAKGAGLYFAFARATQGVSIVDSQFARNWPALRAAGLMRGAYHFASPGAASKDPVQDGKAQAAWFMQALQRAGGIAKGDLPSVLDLEQWPAGLPGDAGANWLMQFAETWLASVDAATGLRCMVYGSHDFLSFVHAGTALAQRDLWLAWPNSSVPEDLRAWKKWACIQYSWKGAVPGIQGAVDLDEWSLPSNDLAHLVGFTPPAPQPAGPKIVLWQSPLLQAPAQELARQYGWQAANTLAAVKGAAAVVCVGGTTQWIADAQAAAGAAWHPALAGPNYWRTLELVAQAGLTGRF